MPATQPSRSYAYLRAADGMPLRYGIWLSARSYVRGMILFLNGRSEFMEKYDETILQLNTKGFDVVSFDWRGQGLSGRMLSDPTRGYVKSYDQYLSDLDLMLRRVVLPLQRGPLHILAHSMGGHIALRWLTSKSGIPLADAVLCSPMIDVDTFPVPRWLARRLAQLMTRAGHQHRTVVGAHRFNPYKGQAEHNRLTSDAMRFRRVQQMVAQNPGLDVGAVTYGWLAATFESIDFLWYRAAAGRSGVPLRVFLAGNDQVVSNRAAELLFKNMDDCAMMVIPGARHEILQEQDHLQACFWREFDRFFQLGPE